MDETADKREDRILARSETDSGTSSEEPPTKKYRYGSQNYWEDRYTSHQGMGQKGTEENSSDALHSWYFTYEDLSPLLLPLILGEGEDDACRDDQMAGHEQSALVTENCRDKESPENAETQDSNGQSSRRDADDADAHNNEHSKANVSIGRDDDDKHEAGHADNSNEYDTDNEHGETNSGGYVEVVEEDDGSDDDEHEQPQHREGLSKSGAISVLEIGCGDVPLGRDLAKSIGSFESQTGFSSSNIVKQVVCIDYAPSCIAALMKEQRSTNDQKIQITYEVGDARKLKYKNESFELILEKGTMDAMLSDVDRGVDNCKLIVAESARLLSIGGYIVIVSHLNAHVQSGMQWLDRIVVPGLRMNSKQTKWEIEVHGNSGDDIPVKNDKDEESPGPAVYIIHKMNSDEDVTASDPPTIPLKFFSYS